MLALDPYRLRMSAITRREFCWRLKIFPRSATAGGFENLLEQGSMTTSRFMEQVSYRAAMETELAASITEIASIRGARVHLAEPQQSVFVRNQVPAKASVVVVTHPGRVVTQSQIRAIVHLVSSSVPYLPAENVSVVDNTGSLLTDTEGENAMTLTTVKQSTNVPGNVLQPAYRTDSGHHCRPW